MRILCTALLASAALAQSSLTTTYTFDKDERGSFFDVSVNQSVVITGLDINIDAGVHSVSIYRPTAGGSHIGIETQSNMWTLVESFSGIVSAGEGNPTPLTLNNPMVINPGGNEGIYILAAGGRPLNSVRTFALGSPYVSDSVMTIYEGQGGISLWNVNQVRMWNGTIHYTTQTGSVASNIPTGDGCGGEPFGNAMIQQQFNASTSPFDLANSSHTWTWIGNGYQLIDGNTTGGIVQPSGAGALSMANNQTLPVTLPFLLPTPAGIVDTVYVCSNGWISFEPTSNSGGAEQVGRFRDNEARVAFLWDQLNVTAAGASIDAEVDAGNPGAFHVTFSDVEEPSIGGSNTVQVTLFSSGNIEVKYGAISVLDGMVGMTTGHGASNFPTYDFSTVASSPPQPMITGVYVPTLGLAAAARPLIGAPWDQQVFDIRPGALFGIGIFGLTNPNIPDLTFLGMPGCGLYASLDLLKGPFVINPGQTTATYGLDLTSATSSALGLELYTQAVVFGNGLNAFNAVTSSSLRGTLGDV